MHCSFDHWACAVVLDGILRTWTTSEMAPILGVFLWPHRLAVFHLFHKVPKTAALTRGVVYVFSTVSSWYTLAACQLGVKRLTDVCGGML